MTTEQPTDTEAGNAGTFNALAQVINGQAGTFALIQQLLQDNKGSIDELLSSNRKILEEQYKQDIKYQKQRAQEEREARDRRHKIRMWQSTLQVLIAALLTYSISLSPGLHKLLGLE